jgi:hydrophobe/amphiphile efflux-1 (HAE1) family protein
MIFSRFFINRPIFATVISIVIVVAGLVTFVGLPVAQYPDILPPTVQVSTVYPGASAQVISETVAQPIEEQVNSVEGMLYMSSNCSNAGEYILTVTFEIGTDLDLAAIRVKNLVSVAEPQLPEDVRRQGITTAKQSPNILAFVSLTSPDGSFDDLFLHNFATLRLKNELTRIEGVGSVWVFGAGDYALRCWLDPELLKARDLTAGDVIAAMREQNVQVAAGQVGQQPVPAGQEFQYTINTLGRLEDVDEFENIIVKAAPGGATVRVRDVARVELGAMTYGTSSQETGFPCAAIAIFQRPGSNSLAVVERVKERIAGLRPTFPDGVCCDIPFDVTLFVRASIDEVIQTLVIAAILVFLVIFLFLQDWRAAVIPGIAIPVSLIGTFAVMGLLGSSINMISLFGIVLAIGVVVDDAIVVVENAVRNIEERKLGAKEATIRAMGEVTGPIVATTLVLLAVFVPTAFLGGITGQLYREFALTIATATVFSTINSLTLSPALCALLLRPAPSRRMFFFRFFNWGFGTTRTVYQFIVGFLIRRVVIVFLLFVILLGGTWWGFGKLPTAFLPNEDQGYLVAAMQLPEGASKARTDAVVEKFKAIVGNIEGIEGYVTISGLSPMTFTTVSNEAASWIILDPWEERAGNPALTVEALVGRLYMELAAIEEANIFVFPPPAIMGLGEAGGFDFRLQDRGDVGLPALEAKTWEMIGAANAQPGLENLFTTFSAAQPQLYADVDRTQAKALGVPLSSLYETLQASLGAAYVNDFNKFGRIYQVKVQADARFRQTAEDVRRLEVRNERGEMVPLGAVVDVRETVGPKVITRYNMYPSISVNGQTANGYSSGQAIAAIEKLARETLPPSMGIEWTGMSFQEKATGGETMFIFVLAVIFVYLALCALYESWSISFAIVLVVPLALLGTVGALTVRMMDFNIYTQIGVVLLIGLASKTAILIVEFAKTRREEGEAIVDAAHEAARLRFRPILMTAFTFVLGVVPLVIATGAGAAGRQALGTAVFGGMIAASVLMLLFVPSFYVAIQTFSEWVRGKGSSSP